MKTLKLLEKTINELAYKRAMERAKRKKSIKSWERLDKKLKQFIKEETEKIIKHIVKEI